MYVCVFTNLFAQARYKTRSIFIESLQRLNSDFPSCTPVVIPRLKSLVYLLVTLGRIGGFILFPRIFVLCEMQSLVKDLNLGHRVACACV